MQLELVMKNLNYIFDNFPLHIFINIDDDINANKNKNKKKQTKIINTYEKYYILWISPYWYVLL